MKAWNKQGKRHKYWHKDHINQICFWGEYNLHLRILDNIPDKKFGQISGLVLRWIKFAFKDPRWYSWHPSSHAGSNLLCSKCPSPGFSNKCQSKQYISQKNNSFCKCCHILPSFHLMLCLQAWKEQYFFIRQTIILEVLLKGCWVEKVMIKLRAKLPFYVCVQIWTFGVLMGAAFIGKLSTS